MEVPRPSDADMARFRALVAAAEAQEAGVDGGPLPPVQIRPMFANLGAFVNGNMFAGLFGSAVGVKLAPDDLEALRARGGGRFGPAERPMAGWVSLPSSMLDDAEAVDRLRQAWAYVASLPPKPEKGSNRRA